MKLWKENRTDQQWELSMEEIAEQFASSQYSPHVIKHWRLERCLRAFLTAPDGLNSVFDEEDFDELYTIVSERVFS